MSTGVHIGDLWSSLILKDKFNEVIDKTVSNVEEASKELSKTGAKMASVGKTLSTRVTAPLAALGGVAFKSFGDFDQAMTNSLAIMGDVSDELQSEMAQAAKDAAVAIDGNAKSATIAAESYFFLASAGLDASQSVAVLDDVTRFAKAGNFDMALATDLLTDAQSALGLSVADTVQNEQNLIKVSDVLVKANTLANATVEQFSTSLTTKAGTAMKLLNVDIESGVAVLAAWADQGVKGQIAGERFDIVTRDLLKVHRDFKGELDKVNIRVFDASGNFRNMADIIEDVERATAGMSAEQVSATLATLGFQNRSIGAIKSLIGLSDKVRGYEVNLRKAGGTTALVAEKQMKSFWSRLELVKNRLTNTSMTIGELMLPAVDKLLDIVDSAVKHFDTWSDSSKQTFVVFSGAVAVLGPVLIVIGNLIKAVGTLATVITKAGAAVIKFTRLLTPMSAALGIVLAAVIKVNDAIVRWGERLRQEIDSIVDATNDFSDGIASIGDETQRVINSGSIQDMSDLLGKQTTRLAELREKQQAAKDELNRLANSLDHARAAGNDHGRWLENHKEKQEAATLAYNQANIEIGKLEKSTDDIKQAMKEWTPEVETVSEAIGGSGSNSLVRTAEQVRSELAALGTKIVDARNATLEWEPVIVDTEVALKDLELEIEDLEPDIESLTEAQKEWWKSLSLTEKAAWSLDKFLGTKLGKTLSDFGRHVNEAADLTAELFGESAAREVQKWGDAVNMGFDAWASFAEGDYVGAVVKGVGALKQAFDNLFPSTKTVEERIAILIGHFEDGEFTLEHWNKLVHDMTRTLEKVADEGWDAARAADIMTESFDAFVDVALTMGDEGLNAIARLVNEAERAGVGLDVIQQRLRDTWEELSDVIEERNNFIAGEVERLVSGLQQMLGDVTNATVANVEFASGAIVSAFQLMVDSGIPVSEALEQIGGLFEQLRDRGLELGVSLGEEFDRVGVMMEILADDKFVRLIERIEGTTDAVMALGNMNLLNEEQFNRFANQAMNVFRQLTEGGLTTREAYAVLQPQLQALHDLSQQYGFVLNDNTQALLDEAEALGFVADKGLTTEDILIKGFDKMTEALNRLIVALGGVPVALDTWGRRANDLNDRMGHLGDRGIAIADHIREAWDRATDSIGKNTKAAERGRGNTPRSDTGRDGGFQKGTSGFVDFGSGTTTTLHGVEEVITIEHGKSIAGMVSTAISSAEGLGSREVLRLLRRLIETAERMDDNNTAALSDLSRRLTSLETQRGLRSVSSQTGN